MSSSAIDAASAAGSVLGGVGGLAGLWALVDQRRERRRQRLAPPPAVLDNILIIREAARQVVASPRSEEWFEEAALVQAADELTRLSPLLERPALARCLQDMQDHWTVASGWGSLIERPDFPLPQSEAFALKRSKGGGDWLPRGSRPSDRDVAQAVRCAPWLRRPATTE